MDKILLGKSGDAKVTLFIDGQGIDEHLGEMSSARALGYVSDELGSVLNSEVARSPRSYGLNGEVSSIYLQLSQNSNPVNYGWQGLEFDIENGLYDNNARTYSSHLARFTSRDPIGFMSGEVNLYRSRKNNAARHIDPFGLFGIVVNEGGTRNGSIYGATITITGDNGQTITVPGSSYPNPNNSAPGIAAGTYSGTYSPTGHRGAVPGVRINNGGYIPTLGPNPAQGGSSTANGVNIHCGYSSTSRGSTNCVTIAPSSCSSAFSVLQPGETGSITIQR